MKNDINALNILVYDFFIAIVYFYLFYQTNKISASANYRQHEKRH